MDMTELATLKAIPVLKAGEHPSRNKGTIIITEEDLDETLQGSNELAEFLKKGHVPDVFTSGKTSRKLPAPLNLLHDDILDDTIRDRVKDVQHSFAKNDHGWIVERFDGVPTDVAKAIQTHFPLRSVDLIPWTNPDTGKHFKHAIVSTAFLNDKYIPPHLPAVSGQDGNLEIEFAGGGEEDPVIVLYSGTLTNQPPQGGSHMDEQRTHEETVTQPELNDTVSELQKANDEKDAEIARLKALTKDGSGKIAELQAARERDTAAILELQRKQEEIEVNTYLKELSLTPRVDDNGVKYTVNKPFLDIIEPLVRHTPHSAMIELAEGSKPTRDAMETVFDQIIEMAAKHAILTPMTELGRMTHDDPTIDKPKTVEDLINQKMEADPTLSYDKAWEQANHELGTFAVPEV